MIVEYLWAPDCPVCVGMKKQEITPKLQRMTAPLVEVSFVSGMINEVTDPYLVEGDDGVTERHFIHSPVMKRMVERRPDGYTGLGTPVLHFVDPTEREYEEIFVADLFESNYELQETLEDDPWLIARMLTREMFDFYVSEYLDKSVNVKSGLREKLEPEFEQGTYQLRRWQDVFTQATI